jgi:hypothetical protein
VKEIIFWEDYENMQSGRWSRQIEEAFDAVELLIMIITPSDLLSSNYKLVRMYARQK